MILNYYVEVVVIVGFVFGYVPSGGIILSKNCYKRKLSTKMQVM